MSQRSVIVIGAGPAGLTAAHELACRGYDVTVVEASTRARAGGKCASQFWRHPKYGMLPGEHGFRFFPGFYHHATALLERIPQDPESASPEDALSSFRPHSVADELVPAEAIALARPGRALQSIPLRPLRESSLIDIAKFVSHSLIDLPLRDAARLGGRFLEFVLSCDERRLQCDIHSFWKFVEADAMSEGSQRMLATRPLQLVAMDGRHGSARTLMSSLWLMMTEWTHQQDSHRVLAGPTSAVWIQPWVRWLERLGVTFRFESEVEALSIDTGARRLTGVTVRARGGREDLVADHYVLAVPIERARDLFTDAIAAAAPALGDLRAMPRDYALGTMNGVQLYLRRPVDLHKAHVGFVESPWALTAVAQHEFWRPDRLERYIGPAGRDREINGVLSLCVTAWDREDGVMTGVRVPNAERDQVVDEIVHQVGQCLDADGRPIITADDVVASHIDEHVVLGPAGTIGGRLLIHPPSFYARRPLPSVDGIDNLCLAGDWVRSQVDLATMEGAIENAMSAVNGILARDGSSAPRCEVTNVVSAYESDRLRFLKRADKWLFDRKLRPSWLSVDVDDIQTEEDLRAYLQTCEGRITRVLERYTGDDSDLID